MSEIGFDPRLLEQSSLSTFHAEVTTQPPHTHEAHDTNYVVGGLAVTAVAITAVVVTRLRGH